MHSHRARRARVRRVAAQHPAVAPSLYLDERQVHVRTLQRLSHHLAFGFGEQGMENGRLGPGLLRGAGGRFVFLIQRASRPAIPESG